MRPGISKIIHSEVWTVSNIANHLSLSLKVCSVNSRVRCNWLFFLWITTMSFLPSKLAVNFSNFWLGIQHQQRRQWHLRRRVQLFDVFAALRPGCVDFHSRPGPTGPWEEVGKLSHKWMPLPATNSQKMSLHMILYIPSFFFSEGLAWHIRSTEHLKNKNDKKKHQFGWIGSTNVRSVFLARQL